MKDDLKNIFSATAIYAALVAGVLILAIPYVLISDKYPVIQDVTRIFGVVYYLVLFGYIAVRWFKTKKKQHP